MTNHWVDIKNANVVVVMGGNAAEAHPVGFRWAMEAKNNNDATLIVVDPRFTRTASVADIYAPIRSGTDITFLSGVLLYLIENNKINAEYVKHYTNANAASGTACKPGKAKVTQVYQPGKAKHPYHLVAVSGGGSTVYGWVDAADIGGSATGGTRTHTVVRGDTLWALASTYLGSGSRYKEIMRLNGLTSEIIHVGQVLKMPAK